MDRAQLAVLVINSESTLRQLLFNTHFTKEEIEADSNEVKKSQSLLVSFPPLISSHFLLCTYLIGSFPLCLGSL